MRAEVDRAVVRDTTERLGAFKAALDDVRQAGRVHEVDMLQADEFAVDVELAESDAA
jgi:hypothetical protein